MSLIPDNELPGPNIPYRYGEGSGEGGELVGAGGESGAAGWGTEVISSQLLSAGLVETAACQPIAADAGAPP